VTWCRPDSRAASWLAVWLPALLLAIPAGATTLDFEGFATPVDAAGVAFPEVSISTSLLLTESDAALLTGFDTSGWATSGVAGLLNSEAPVIQFDFDAPANRIEAEVFFLPENEDLGVGIMGVPANHPGHAILIGYFYLPTLMPPLSGSHFHLSLGFDGAQFSSIQILAITDAECAPDCTPSSRTSTLFIDDFRFLTVPEPTTTVLAIATLASMAVRRRARGA